MRRRTGRKLTAPGFGQCHRCRHLCENVDLVEMARPGKAKGVWLCPHCARESEATS